MSMNAPITVRMGHVSTTLRIVSIALVCRRRCSKWNSRKSSAFWCSVGRLSKDPSRSVSGPGRVDPLPGGFRRSATSLHAENRRSPRAERSHRQEASRTGSPGSPNRAGRTRTKHPDRHAEQRRARPTSRFGRSRRDKTCADQGAAAQVGVRPRRIARASSAARCRTTAQEPKRDDLT